MFSLLDFLKCFFHSCRKWQGQKREEWGKEVDNEARPLMKRNGSKGLGEQGRERRVGRARAKSSLCTLWSQNADWCLMPLFFVYCICFVFVFEKIELQI